MSQLVISKSSAVVPRKKHSRRMSAESELTENQEAFCRLIAEQQTDSITDAYYCAYPNDESKRTTMMANASRLYNKEHIQKRIEVLRNAIVARCPVTKTEAMARLASIIRGQDDDKAIVAIRELKSLLPEWVEPATDHEAEAISITITTEQREKPVRSMDDIVVDNVIDVVGEG